mgnify:CR=1 FL=1
MRIHKLISIAFVGVYLLIEGRLFILFIQHKYVSMYSLQFRFFETKYIEYNSIIHLHIK